MPIGEEVYYKASIHISYSIPIQSQYISQTERLRCCLGGLNDEVELQLVLPSFCGGTATPPRWTCRRVDSQTPAITLLHCNSLLHTTMALDRALKRLSLESSSVCRQCRRAFASSARTQQRESETGAFASMQPMSLPSSHTYTNPST